MDLLSAFTAILIFKPLIRRHHAQGERRLRTRWPG
jgi:hypothetical protein